MRKNIVYTDEEANKTHKEWIKSLLDDVRFDIFDKYDIDIKMDQKWNIYYIIS